MDCTEYIRIAIGANIHDDIYKFIYMENLLALQRAIYNCVVTVVLHLGRIRKGEANRAILVEPAHAQPFVHKDKVLNAVDELYKVINNIYSYATEAISDSEKSKAAFELTNMLYGNIENAVIDALNVTMKSDFPHADNLVRVDPLSNLPNTDICITVTQNF